MKEGDSSAVSSSPGLLDGCRVYHFHDTSDTARIRQYGYIDDN